MNEKQAADEFAELVRPLMRWLDANHHPHTTIIIDNMHAEIVEGVRSYVRDESIDPLID